MSSRNNFNKLENLFTLNKEDLLKVIELSSSKLFKVLKRDGIIPESIDTDIFTSLLARGFFMDFQERKRELFKIGKEYYKNYIPFYNLVCALDQIEKQVLEEISNCERNNIKAVCNYFENVKDQISYGYLYSMVVSDKDLVRKELKAVKGKNIELREFLRKYLIWVNKVSEDIKKLRSNSLKDFLKSVPILNDENEQILKFFTAEDAKAIIDVHNRLINISFIIANAIKNKRFTILASAYMEFMKLIGKFVSLASVNIAVRYSEELNKDALTGALNRRALDLILNSQFQVAKITNKPLSIALIDIDDFKMINDTYGHIIGDCVLKRLAQELKRSIRDVDLIFRYGGEEFLILFPFTEKEFACKKMNEILKNVKEKLFTCLDKKLKISFSAGVESISPLIESSFEFIENADKKLYKAKDEGKGKIVC